VGLVVAALDLKLVRLVRAAMQPGVGPAGGVDGTIRPTPVFEPRRRIEPEPVIEPRQKYRPEPVFEPRQRLGGGLRCDCAGETAPAAPTEPVEKVSRSVSPIEPPWKVLPWEQPPDAHRVRPLRKIKVIQPRPDMQCKGTVIDIFI
jgi:hypothetical protein